MKVKKILPNIIIIGCFLIPGILFGQVAVIPGSMIDMTPEELINTYLLGSGVTVVPGTATFNGNPATIGTNPSLIANQIGTFTTQGQALKSIGLQGGIILCSGNVSDVSTFYCNNPPHNCNPASTSTNSGSDPDLNILVDPFGSNDKSILECGFQPGRQNG